MNVQVNGNAMYLEETKSKICFLECEEGHFFELGEKYPTNKTKYPRNHLKVDGLGKLYEKENGKIYQRIYVKWV